MQVLAVNPGNTSTKIAVYADDECVFTTTVSHPDAELARFTTLTEQLGFRTSVIEEALLEHGVAVTDLAAVVGRGGMLPPLPGGTYRVDAALLDDLRAAARGVHASNLGGQIAHALAGRACLPSFIVDPVSTDELRPLARVTGLPGVRRTSMCHALNMKAVGRMIAGRLGLEYSSARLVVAHLGTGVSMSAHEGGRMVDISDGRVEGAMSADRAGAVPADALIRLCYADGATLPDTLAAVTRTAGMFAWLGTRDLREAEATAERGDERANLFLDAMAYQIAKEIGSLAAALGGRIDAVALTGGMAYSDRVVPAVTERVSWIAPVMTVPGEHEMFALSQGALRVLRGDEPALDYAEGVRRGSATSLPEPVAAG